jgi:hypothetical protein
MSNPQEGLGSMECVCEITCMYKEPTFGENFPRLLDINCGGFYKLHFIGHGRT